MPVNVGAYRKLISEVNTEKVIVVAVSKKNPVTDIQLLYDLGHRDFGENYVQELLEKSQQLPPEIQWHFIGHLQKNKVKFIVPFVHLIHSVDSLKLLHEINKQGNKISRTIDCLLQIYIAREETKFGMDEHELKEVMLHVSKENFKNVRIKGLMGMASFTEDTEKIKNEFNYLQGLYSNINKDNNLNILSMGMTADYPIAINSGSNLIRIGSLIFGKRQ